MIILVSNVCVIEFIHLIASEASEISDREQRKTILPEHIIEALTVRWIGMEYPLRFMENFPGMN